MNGSSRVDSARLGERLAALGGLERVRAAAGSTPAYLVGGAVRDLLLGRERTDVDVAVEGEVESIAGRLGGELVTHERFGTASVRADGLEVDLAPTRAESYPRPGALPEVRPAGIDEDLARRDFTINAMAIPLAGEPRLIDPHGGERDLAEGLLRVLHGRSFVDDPTRALRAARYAARFDLRLEEKTAALLRETDFATVSADRIDAELLKLAAEPEPQRGFALLDRWGLVPQEPGTGELIEATASLLAAPPWSEVAERPLAIHAAAVGRAPGEAGRLRDLRAAAEELSAASPRRPSEAVAAARGHGPVELVLARAMGAEWLDRYITEWRSVVLEITGDDLLAAGVPEGPRVGRGLAAGLAKKLDGEVSGREEELRAALEAARAGS